MAMINCCKDCKAPKRHPGCHDHCPEYRVERVECDKRKAIYDKEQALRVAFYEQRTRAVTKALKRKGKDGK